MLSCWTSVLLIWLFSRVCRGAELDSAEVMVISDDENEDTLDSSWSSDSEYSLVTIDSSIHLDSSPFSICSLESCDESED